MILEKLRMSQGEKPRRKERLLKCIITKGKKNQNATRIIMQRFLQSIHPSIMLGMICTIRQQLEPLHQPHG